MLLLAMLLAVSASAPVPAPASAPTPPLSVPAAAPAAAAPSPATAPPALPPALAAPQQVTFSWTLVALVAAALVLLVEVFRALPWSDAARASRALAQDGMMVLWVGLLLGLLLGLWQGALMGALHTPPAAAVALFALAALQRLRR